MSSFDNSESNQIRMRKLLVLSIFLNLFLLPISGYGLFQNSQLREQINGLSSSINEISETSKFLEQQLNISESQIDYYKELALYYSSLQNPEDNTEHVIGQSTLPIVAVQMIQNMFQIEYKGVVMNVDIELVEGSGRVLVDTVPKIGIDIQTSFRTAVIVAEELTGFSLGHTDVILTVRASQEVDVVDGESAGAAITVALMAAMTNQSVNQGIYMTGTINADMTVGPVSGIPYKALAAAENGSIYFIVPEKQSTVVIYKPSTYKTFRGRVITTYETENIDLEDYLKENGYTVQVLEVKNIEEAYAFFTQPLSDTLK